MSVTETHLQVKKEVLSRANEDVLARKEKKKRRRNEDGEDRVKKDKKKLKLEGSDEVVASAYGETKRKKKRSSQEDATEMMPAAVNGKDRAPKNNEEKKRAKKEEKEARKKRKADAAAALLPAEGFNSTPDCPASEDRERKKKKKEKNDRESSEVFEMASKESELSNVSQPQVSSTSTASQSILADSDVAAYLTENDVTVQADSIRAPTSPLADVLKPFTSFSVLLPHIPAKLHSAFATFKEPSPIQACCWPAALQGRDVIGIAETGSGKTLAFGIPAVSQVAKASDNPSAKEESGEGKKKKSKKNGVKGKVSVLVLAPTRELAIQTHETLMGLGKPFGLSSVALYGGVPKEAQKSALRESGAAFIAGTPGRILDLVNEGACDLSGVTYLVLDEADRMLDKGFENDIRTIIGHTSSPEKRQTLMFSATWPDLVRKLAASFLRSPVHVTVGSDDLSANRRVEQVVEVFDDTRQKDSRLLSHLRTAGVKPGNKSAEPSRILIFVLYKKEASRVEQTLNQKGFRVAGIHGDLSQTARIAALDDFKSGKAELLVATDVAARGLDIPNVSMVINYSFPLTVEDYIHRIGRTGRGGRSGKSLTFFTGDAHERSLAGEFAKVLREAGFDATALQDKFPMTIKKKTHSVYGAFYRDDIASDVKPKKLVF